MAEVLKLWETRERIAEMEALALGEIAEVVNRQIGRLPKASSLRASLVRCGADLADAGPSPPARDVPSPHQPSLFVQPV